mgnify:CR=1 FL=1
MRTRPRPPLTLRQIWEKPDDYGSDKIFTSLAVRLEDAINEADCLESDLTEETERRVESIDELAIDIRNLDITLVAHSASLSEQDRPEILADICKRLAKLEAHTGLEAAYEGMNRNSPVQPDRKAQLAKYPNMLKTGGK